MVLPLNFVTSTVRSTSNIFQAIFQVSVLIGTFQCINIYVEDDFKSTRVNNVMKDLQIKPALPMSK